MFITERRLKIKYKRFILFVYIVNLLSVFYLVQRILNYYPNYPNHRLYFGEVETPYSKYIKKSVITTLTKHLLVAKLNCLMEGI